MEKCNPHEIQWNKMKTGYATMSKSKINRLKEQILSCIASRDIHEYLSQHFEMLSSWDLIEMIVGAQKPLAVKFELLTKLVELFPHPFPELDSCYDFEPYVEQCKQAFNDMQNNNGDVGVYLLNQYNYHEIDGKEVAQCIPFLSFPAAIEYIKNNANDWLVWSRNGNCVEEVLTWFELEKWVGNDRTFLKATYTISKYGEIWDYHSEKSKLHHRFGMSNALGLCLPVPFAAGDVITIDCRPFAPLKHGVIVSVGDNRDCCCVQCLYTKTDGTLNIGALKHAHVFDDGWTPYISPLYKAQKSSACPAGENAYFHEIGKAIAHWDAEWHMQKDFNVHSELVCAKVWGLLSRENTPDGLISLIKREVDRR